MLTEPASRALQRGAAAAFPAWLAITPPWRAFATFTFHGPTDDLDFVMRLAERYYEDLQGATRSSVAAFVAVERSLSGMLHLHCLVTRARGLPARCSRKVPSALQGRARWKLQARLLAGHCCLEHLWHYGRAQVRGFRPGDEVYACKRPVYWEILGHPQHPRRARGVA